MLQLYNHILQNSSASRHTPNIVTTPNLVPKVNRVLNSLFLTKIFFVIVRVLFKTSHFLTKRAIYIPVKKVSQMSPVIQVQSNTVDGFPNRHKREQNSWLVTTPRLKARLRPDSENVAEDQFVWKPSASWSLSSSVLLLRLLRLKLQSNKGSIASFILFCFGFFCIVLLAKRWTPQQQRHPQRLYRVVNRFLKKYLPVSVSFCLNHILTAIGKTHISVLSLHNSHAAAASDILIVQTLVQIFQTMRIKKGPNLQS